MANPLCHFELMTADPKRAKSFYGKVFNWKFDEESMPGYSLIDTGTEPTGALFARPEGAPGVCANIYFQVADIDTTLEKATGAGGTVVIPKTQIPNAGYFAMFTDPDGIAVGIMKPEH